MSRKGFHSVSLSEEVLRRIAARAEDGDDADTALRRIFGLPERANRKRSYALRPYMEEK